MVLVAWRGMMVVYTSKMLLMWEGSRELMDVGDASLAQSCASYIPCVTGYC